MWCALTAALYTFCCCHFYRSLPLVPILNQINLVPTLPTYFFKIHFNIILPSMPMSFKCSFSFRFHQHILEWVQYLLYFVDHNLQYFLENTVWILQYLMVQRPIRYDWNILIKISLLKSWSTNTVITRQSPWPLKHLTLFYANADIIFQEFKMNGDAPFHWLLYLLTYPMDNTACSIVFILL